jgi:hypothetical protein
MKNARPNNANNDKETLEVAPISKSSLYLLAQSGDTDSVGIDSEDINSAVTDSEDINSAVTDSEDINSAVTDSEDIKSAVTDSEDIKSAVTDSEDIKSADIVPSRTLVSNSSMVEENAVSVSLESVS